MHPAVPATSTATSTSPADRPRCVVGVPLVPFAALAVLYGLAGASIGWFRILVVLAGAAVTAAVAVWAGARAAVRGSGVLHETA